MTKSGDLRLLRRCFLRQLLHPGFPFFQIVLQGLGELRLAPGLGLGFAVCRHVNGQVARSTSLWQGARDTGEAAVAQW